MLIGFYRYFRSDFLYPFIYSSTPVAQQKLNGEWKFQNNSEGGSIVSLNMEFEFKNKLLKYAFGSAFVVITDSLVDAFVERARIIYK